MRFMKDQRILSRGYRVVCYQSPRKGRRGIKERNGVLRGRIRQVKCLLQRVMLSESGTGVPPCPFL